MISIKSFGGEAFQMYSSNDIIDEHNAQSLFRNNVFFKLLKEKQDATHDLLCPSENGEFHWYRFTFKTICDEQGNPAYCIGKISDIDEEKKEKERLKQQAQLDGLTGLFNVGASRKLIHQKMMQLSDGQCDGLLLIDVDNFKHVNDSFGHLNGDKVLCNLAALLKKSFDDSRCVIGRPGGDEFIVYVSNTNKEELTQCCEVLLEHVRAMINEEEIHISVSVGGVLVKAGDLFEEVYQRADEAMYASKHNGRNCYAIEE